MCGILFPFFSLLRTIFFRCSHFLCWNTGNEIKNEGAVAIAKALKSNKCLKSLNLACKCCVNQSVLGISCSFRFLWCFHEIVDVEICFCFVVCCTVLFFSGFLTSCVEMQTTISGMKEKKPLQKHWSWTSSSKSTFRFFKTWTLGDSLYATFYVLCFFLSILYLFVICKGGKCTLFSMLLEAVLCWLYLGQLCCILRCGCLVLLVFS